MPIALITGITGQDGSYLAEYLLGLGYEVHGTSRDPEAARLHPNIASCASRLRLHALSLERPAAIADLLGNHRFDEIYHLAAQTHVAESFKNPIDTFEFNTLGTIRLLEAVRSIHPATRIFHAASSQVFGNSSATVQTEDTPFRPMNPYGVSKAAAAEMVRIHRDAYRLFAVNGICYNHESPRRGPEFVTGKICRAAAAFRTGRTEPLLVGDVRAQRDWGDARSFVRGFHASLQASAPSDYIFATGILHSVRDVLQQAFEAVGLHWEDWVRHDTSLLRPAEPPPAAGDPSRAAKLLGWQNSTSFEQLIREMTLAHLPAAGPTTAS